MAPTGENCLVFYPIAVTILDTYHNLFASCICPSRQLPPLPCRCNDVRSCICCFDIRTFSVRHFLLQKCAPFPPQPVAKSYNTSVLSATIPSQIQDHGRLDRLPIFDTGRERQSGNRKTFFISCKREAKSFLIGRGEIVFMSRIEELVRWTAKHCNANSTPNIVAQSFRYNCATELLINLFYFKHFNLQFSLLRLYNVQPPFCATALVHVGKCCLPS